MSSKSERRACEFRLLRYVPDAVRNEYVHIGVILREQGSREPAEVRFTHDWRRVRCLDPEADTALLSLPAGMEELMRLYVEPPPRERVPRLSGRAAIQARMRTEFERAGVWDLMRKKIAASEYTRPGDPLRIDVGYRPNGVIRMFHAVSLEPGVEMAKVLAFSSSGLRAGVERVEKAQLELTAVIEPAAKLGATDEEPERLEMYRFGVETMEEHQIRVLTTSDLGRVAETARRELRV